jgi:hypothetical protein
MTTCPSDIDNARLAFAGTRLGTDGESDELLIKFKLFEGYPTFSHNDDQTTGTEAYIIRASDLSDFIDLVFPPLILGPTTAIKPARLPMRGAPALRAKQLDAEPFNGDLPSDPFGVDTGAPANTYDDLMKVTIRYETSQLDEDEEPDEDDPETFLTINVNAGGEFLQINPKKTKMQDTGAGGSADDEQNRDLLMPMVKSIINLEWSAKWESVLNPPWATIYDQLGTVNNTKSTLFNDAETETVMFQGVSGSRKFVFSGFGVLVQPWNLTFKFSQKYINDPDLISGNGIGGWNHAWAPDKQRWVRLMRLIDDDTTAPLHSLKDQSLLFKF